LQRFKYIILIINILFFTPQPLASPHVDVNDETYDVLLRLEAEGIIKSGLLTTRPISQKEAVRLVAEAEKHPRSESPFIKQLVDFLKKRFKPHLKDTDHIKPVDIIYGEYVFSQES
jgi:hypothetical protein